MVRPPPMPLAAVLVGTCIVSSDHSETRTARNAEAQEVCLCLCATPARRLQLCNRSRTSCPRAPSATAADVVTPDGPDRQLVVGHLKVRLLVINLTNMGGQGILTIPHAPYQGVLRRRQRQRGDDLNSLSSIRSKAASGDLSLRVKQIGRTRGPLDETKGDDRCDVGLVSLCPTTILSAVACLLYATTM